jgi:hypothetical protein
MAAPRMVIFYEDQRGDEREFSLHTLVVIAVAERLGLPESQVKPQLRPFPAKGDSNLLGICEFDVPDMREHCFVALFDADKLHRLLKLPRESTPDVLLAALRQRCTDQRLHFMLLDRNTETVVDAAAECLEQPLPEAKTHLVRDKLLRALARAMPSARDCVREKVPTFAAFIDGAAELLKPFVSARS